MVESGATRNICGNKSALTSYIVIKEQEEQVFMGDSRSSLVISTGKVLLKQNSKKVLTLSDILHVFDIGSNLV